MTEETQEKHSLNKQFLLASFFGKYKDVVEFVNTLDIHQQFKLNAITRLDEMMFWVREGIINIAAPENDSIIEPTKEDKVLEEIPAA